MRDRQDIPLHAPLEAIDLLAALLSEAEGGPGPSFYSRMAEATSRIGGMRRAIVFIYDEERRGVRAVGAHGVDATAFAEAAPTAGEVALARRALAEDRVVEVVEEAEREFPEEFHPLLSGGPIACTPMSAGGRWVGVIIADRDPGSPPLSDAQRERLWTLGKLAALAAAARIATRQQELARQLEERLRLAREIHDAVVQRLFGISLALAGDGPLPAEVRERSRAEVQAALGELRAALQRPPERPAQRTSGRLQDELRRLRRHHRDIPIELERGEDVEVPDDLEPLAQSVLLEAVRNASKHADPTRIDVRLQRAEGTFVLEVVNDGVPPTRRRRRAAAAGMGLRLAAFEALEHGGLVEFGTAGKGQWRVRLTVPLEDA